MMRLAAMVSGGGTNLQAVIDGMERGEIEAELALVISSKPGVYALERARRANIPTCVIARGDYPDEAAFTAANLRALAAANVEGVVLAGYMSILAPEFIRAYPERIINIHPSLIPAFCGKGYYGARVHRAVLEYGVKVSGATVHFVDEGADTGPIILQSAVPVYPTDDPETLAARVLEQEHKILPRAVALFAAGRLRVEGRIVSVWNEEREIAEQETSE